MRIYLGKFSYSLCVAFDNLNFNLLLPYLQNEVYYNFYSSVLIKYYMCKKCLA